MLLGLSGRSPRSISEAAMCLRCRSACTYCGNYAFAAHGHIPITRCSNCSRGVVGVVRTQPAQASHLPFSTQWNLMGERMHHKQPNIWRPSYKFYIVGGVAVELGALLRPGCVELESLALKGKPRLLLGDYLQTRDRCVRLLASTCSMDSSFY